MVERVFNKQALRTVWKLLMCFFSLFLTLNGIQM